MAATVQNNKATDPASRWLKESILNKKDSHMTNNTLKTQDKQHHISQSDIHAECKNHMLSNGLTIDGSIVADGKIHRFSADDKKNKKDEWYIAWEGISTKGNHYLTCIYGSWREDSRHEFKSWENEKFRYEIDEKEKDLLHKELKKKREEAEKSLKEEQEKAAKEANKIWENAFEKPQNETQCRYIKNKSIQPLGIRYGKNPFGYDSIIIPIKNLSGEIQSLQFISCSKEETYKTFLPGGEKKGNFSQLGEIINGESFYIAEGYATGASIHEAVEKPVIISFDSGNISNVIRNLREEYPENEIIIAADNDQSGIGQSKAEEAAKVYGCKVVIPSFQKGKDRDDNGKRFSDFNDLHTSSGIEEVKRQLQQDKENNVFKPHSLEDLLQMPDKIWLIDQVIGSGDLGMIYGPPGGGKTFVTIDMIIACCLGGRWAGRFQVNKPLNVAYCAGEGLSGLKSRFQAAVEYHAVEMPLKNFSFFNTMPQLFDESIEPVKKFVEEWKLNQKKGITEQLDILFIDTLHTATVGADENSSKDMGKALHLCRYLAEELECAVFLVHHTNKAGTGERGSSALRGAMDVMIEIKKSSDTAVVTSMECSKLKDGEQWERQNFELVSVTGTKSVAVRWRDPMDIEAKGKQEAAFETIKSEMKTYPGKKFTVKQIAEVIGATDNHTRNLLARMVKDKICERSLKDPEKESNRNNPWVYWID